VADLRRLAEDTHDFEASYLDGMVGPLPDAEHLYVQRSPLSHLDRLRTPLLIEQGLEDRVVPPSQSEAVRDALAANGVRHAYLAFEGEGHGFRGAETLVRTLEAEVAFLGQVFGFETPGIPPLSLE
jgi:dipeptidyl aminopeptidase/acylaminoacyl peptidase